MHKIKLLLNAIRQIDRPLAVKSAKASLQWLGGMFLIAAIPAMGLELGSLVFIFAISFWGFVYKFSKSWRERCERMKWIGQRDTGNFA